ncbi:transcription initiation factor TFIID subunit 8 [Diospyros lotus]|uniref:transcription initiation factor TFIID subunit 8 n=1 Tax=Diospyros lotus TaxID=55363 RepID=UPI002253189D|nr:transcription initiation factor TFIID subunit 8 [Diospyros lotus]XP_052173069.1 transcription initiation factor TFIID subunit 8 [Diospyros lotus]XP_052173070.1 transcription initiation factor TFIID subunit 8 [Diospyros lotus]
MNDGGREESVKREKEGGNEARRRAGADEFGRAVSRIAVAQVCESVGFESFNESALEALTDIAVRYLRDLGKTASFYANLAGRTECNVFDVVQGLEDLGSSSGFAGASEIRNCITGSGMVKELVEYVENAEEIPFAQPVPHFPVMRTRTMIPSFFQMGETPPFKHIPPWLPAFPDPHTYIHTPTWNERETDPRADKIELARQRRKAERSLLSLQQRLVGHGSEIASTSMDADRKCKALHVTETTNPFLAEPLQDGEQDVSLVPLPAKLSDKAYTENHVSVLDTFTPAIEAVKSGFPDTGDIDRNIPLDKRPAVRLNFKTGKKVLRESLDVSLLNRGSKKSASWIGRDDEKDDKKRRAELILRQSMENPQELSQL